MRRATRGLASTALSPGASVTDQAIATRAVATAFRVTTTHARSPAAAGSAPLLIQPPRSAATQTSCKGALLIANANASTNANTAEEHISATFRSTRTSLLSPALYRCTQGSGVENGFTLIEQDGIGSPHRGSETKEPNIPNKLNRAGQQS
jgi:hypothetical protein